jgi:flagellar hook-associated protein 1 FlgK
MTVAIGSLGAALRTAQSGLATTQQVLDVIANNVANVNTAGYSRKEAALDHRVLGGQGVGVGIERISRAVDQALMTTLRRESARLASASIANGYEARLQDLFGTPGSSTSIAHTLGDLKAAIEALAAAPDGAIEARQVVRQGVEAADALNRLGGTLQQLRVDADRRLAQAVGEADALLKRVADLNHQVVRERHAGRDTTALEDERDRVVDRLSALMDVKVMGRGKGDLVVFTPSGRSLVDSAAVALSHAPASGLSALSTHDGGGIAGIHAGDAQPGNDLTQVLAAGDGEIAALIRLRDRTLPDVQGTLDALAANLRDTVNRIHNQGVGVPGLSRMEGSRRFADPAVETISLAAGDTAIALFDASGRQVAATAVSTLMGGGSGPWTITQVGTALDGWLKANADPAAQATAADGRLVLDLGTRAMGLAFRDQVAAAAGSAPGAATIAHSADGGGGADATVVGFSHFFGLNDFFTDATLPAVRQSAVLPAGWRTAAAASLECRDAAGLIGAAVAIPAGSDLAAIADAIRSATGLATSIVPDGDGFRLRLQSPTASTLVVTETAGGLLAALGLGQATSGLAGSLAVRADLVADPSRIARGQVQFDATRGAAGEYVLGRGDGRAMADLAAAFARTTTFADAGSLPGSTDTLVGYAERIVAQSASRAAEIGDRESFQKDYVAQLQAKSDGIRGVNLDQELSDMMLFEQAYAAAARLISVVQRMFDALEGAV